jgi:hypothetical protein
MLSMTKKTKLSPEEASERVLAFLIEEEKLQLVEATVHMHGEHGALELRAAGDSLAAGNDGVSRRKLLELADHAGRELKLTRIHEMLHIHPAKQELGHLMVRIDRTDPTEVHADSQELEPQLRKLMAELPQT